jgi:hypothetical protein
LSVATVRGVSQCESMGAWGGHIIHGLRTASQPMAHTAHWLLAIPFAGGGGGPPVRRLQRVRWVVSTAARSLRGPTCLESLCAAPPLPQRTGIRHPAAVSQCPSICMGGPIGPRRYPLTQTGSGCSGERGEPVPARARPRATIAQQKAAPQSASGQPGRGLGQSWHGLCKRCTLHIQRQNEQHRGKWAVGPVKPVNEIPLPQSLESAHNQSRVHSPTHTTTSKHGFNSRRRPS